MIFSAQQQNDYIVSLRSALEDARDGDDLYRQIVNVPFATRTQAAHYFLGIIVLLLLNKETGLIERVALSDTDFAQRTLDVSMVPFEQIKIPAGDEVNIIAKAIREGTPQSTTDWRVLFHPAMNASQSRINQANSGIAYSQVHPLTANEGGALIYSFYQYPKEIGEPQRHFMERYTRIVDERLRRHAPV